MGELSAKVIHVFPGVRPGGGPAGYAHNLKQALALVGAPEEVIRIFSPCRPRGSVPVAASKNESVKFRLLKRLPPYVSGPLVAFRALTVAYNAFRYFGFSPEQVQEIKRAKAVIFHDSRLASSYFRMRDRPTEQTVLIMPHSPTDLSSELIENWSGNFGPSRVWSGIRQALMRMELETLLKAEALIAPCRNALEHYFVDVADRNALLGRVIYELKSGVPERVAQRDREEVLGQWGVRPDVQVVGYFGRRHPHKGYDLFCRAAEKAYKDGYTNLIFVSAGTGHLSSPTHLPNFRDLGYLTDELADAIAAVDLVVVPNRVSYFDLLILEAMSLGKPVLTSRVGGNVCFGSPGIHFFEDLSPESLLSTMVKLLLDPAQLKAAGRANRRVYDEQYTLNAFGKRHLEFAYLLLELGVRQL